MYSKTTTYSLTSAFSSCVFRLDRPYNSLFSTSAYRATMPATTSTPSSIAPYRSTSLMAS
ncbi:hypothetical protein BJX70DRAFT_367890 [Aspergillus crustosus]